MAASGWGAAGRALRGAEPPDGRRCGLRASSGLSRVLPRLKKSNKSPRDRYLCAGFRAGVTTGVMGERGGSVLGPDGKDSTERSSAFSACGRRGLTAAPRCGPSAAPPLLAVPWAQEPEGPIAGWQRPARPADTASPPSQPHRAQVWPWEDWGSFMLRLRTKVNDCEGGRSLSPALAAAVSRARSQLSPQVSPPQRQHSAPLPAPPGPTCQLCAPAAPSAAGVLHPGTAASRCVFSTILLCFGEVLVCAPSHQPGRAPHRRAAPPAAGCHRHRELCQCSSSFLHELSLLQGLPRCCEARGKRRGTGGGGWSCCSSSAGRP